MSVCSEAPVSKVCFVVLLARRLVAMCSLFHVRACCVNPWLVVDF